MLPSSLPFFRFSISSRLSRFFPSRSLPPTTLSYPKQHPSSLYNSSEKPLISPYQRPASYVTKPNMVPFGLYVEKGKEFKCGQNAKVLKVGVVGGTNVGKSSLFNSILSSSISAVSPKSGTTDQAIFGHYTNLEVQTQIHLYDTPGFTGIGKGFEKKVIIPKREGPTSNALAVLNDVDYILFLVSATSKRIDPKTRECLSKISAKEGISKSLVVNKVDLCHNKRELKWFINELEDLANFDKTFYTSCLTSYGIQEIKKFLESEAKYGKWEFDPEIKTKMSDIERIEQKMKEMIYERMHEELPFRIGYEVIEFVAMTDGRARVTVELSAESVAQIKMLIGYRGRNANYFKDKLRTELISIYNKDFIVKLKFKLSKGKNFEQFEEIMPEDYGITKIKEEMERLKMEHNMRANLAQENLKLKKHLINVDNL